IAYHDLTGADLPVFLLAVIAAQSFIQKILRQPFCPCPRTGKKENLKPSLFPGLEILYQQIKASVIGTDRLYLHLVTFPKLPVASPLLHQRKRNSRKMPYGRRHFPAAFLQSGLLREHISL